MAYSYTYGQTVNVQTLIDHGARRCGKLAEELTSEQVLSARQSLGFLLSNLINRGIQYWCITKEVIGLTPDKYRYTLPDGAVDTLNVLYRTMNRPDGAYTSSAGGVVANPYDGNIDTYTQQTSANGNFTVNCVLGKMDGTKLNPISEGLGMIKVEKLDIEKLTATVNGNNNFATGDVSFAYHDLSITALKKDDDNKFKKKRLASFMANKFLLNSKSNGKRIQHVRYERDSRKSFFNLIWKTVSKGVAETVIGK
jgi:hypothetical protein